MTTPLIFDRRRLRRRRDRAARAADPEADFLKARMTADLHDRLATIRKPFARALDLGCHTGQTGRMLAALGVASVISCDLSPVMAARAPGLRVAASEEWLPFADGAFDLIVSAGSLHWVNDLPGALAQIYRCLAADGLFLAVFPGGETLRELRAALLEAEMECLGGARPHVAPMVDLQSAAGLLQRAGFALPVADMEPLTLSYADGPALLAELRRMGETAPLAAGPGYLRRDVLARAMALYQARFGDGEDGGEGRITARVDLVTLTGWKPHASQPQPAKRGSGQVSLARFFGSDAK